MIEAIILSACCLFIGASVGAFISSNLFNRVKMVKLDNGNKICMWKGFVDPSLTYVTAYDPNDDSIDGDAVVFDKNGNIIIIDKNVKAW